MGKINFVFGSSAVRADIFLSSDLQKSGRLETATKNDLIFSAFCLRSTRYGDIKNTCICATSTCRRQRNATCATSSLKLVLGGSYARMSRCLLRSAGAPAYSSGLPTQSGLGPARTLRAGTFFEPKVCAESLCGRLA